MSGLVAVLIFGVAYPIIALGVACVGTFGLAVNSDERYERAVDTNPYSFIDPDAHGRYRYLTFLSAVVVLVAAAAWPIGIPLWFAWRKGELINDTVAKRAEMLKDAA